MKAKRLSILAGLMVGLVCSSFATVILNDHFITASVEPNENNAAKGQYRDVHLTNVNNRAVAGGSIVGFSSGALWSSTTDRPMMVTTGLTSVSVAAEGGAVAFRGGLTGDQYIHRIFNYTTGPATLYFSGTLRTTLLDNDAVSLIGFSNTNGDTTAINMLANTGGFYNGLAFGFKGNGSGMDLIVRYRSSNTAVYVDTVLVQGISTNTPYTVMGKINWDAGANSRDPFTVWVNPTQLTEPVSGGFTTNGFLGDSNVLKQVNLLQKNFGSGTNDVVYMDEIRLANNWAGLQPYTNLYVATNGNDSTGTGSISSPWKTIEKAKTEVRTRIASGLTYEGIVVQLDAGNYELTNTLAFVQADCIPYGRVTYAAKGVPGTTVIRAKSKVTSSWIYHTNGIWKVNVGSGLSINTLYEGDVRADMARHPNRKQDPLYPVAWAPWLCSLDGAVSVSNTNRSWITYATADMSPVDVSLAKYITIFPWGEDNWGLWTCSITSIDTATQMINFDNFGKQTEIGTNCRYFVSGALEYLDVEGEFHYDTASGYLYYKPRNPGDPSGKNISVPTLKQLINIAGTTYTNVAQGLYFEGLVFANTAANVPGLSYFEVDYGFSDDGIIKMENTKNMQFDRCHIKNSGRQGILAVGENRDIQVLNSLVENTGGSGICLSNRKGSTPSRIKDALIYNSIIQKVGTLFLYAEGITLFSTESCIVDHCEFYDSTRYAISLRGNVLSDGTGYNSYPPSSNNIVRNCWMERCVQDSGDAATLHMAGINNGTSGYTNYFKNIYIYNTQSVIQQNDTSLPKGIYCDWPGATLLQSFENIWVDRHEGLDICAREENQTQTVNNVSWITNSFNSGLMDLDQIGLASDLPAGFGLSQPDYEPERDIIIDNNDPGFRKVGSMSDSDHGRRKNAWDSAYPMRGSLSIAPANITNQYAIWTPTIKDAGYYEVYTWKVQYQQTGSVAYKVVSAGVTNTVTHNYQDDYSQLKSWERLGTFYFNPGTNGYVRLDANTATAGVMFFADAIRFLYASLWQDDFLGYPAGNLIGQNGWTNWAYSSPVVVSTVDCIRSLSTEAEETRAKRLINSAVSSNAFITIQADAYLADSSSDSGIHVGLGNLATNSMGTGGVGMNATGIFFSTNGIASSGFVYGYLDGVKYTPVAGRIYTIKAVLDTATGKASLGVSTNGGAFKQLAFDSARTAWTTAFNTSQVPSWNAVYVRLLKKQENRIYSIMINDNPLMN